MPPEDSSGTEGPSLSEMAEEERLGLKEPGHPVVGPTGEIGGGIGLPLLAREAAAAAIAEGVHTPDPD